MSNLLPCGSSPPPLSDHKSDSIMYERRSGRSLSHGNLMQLGDVPEVLLDAQDAKMTLLKASQELILDILFKNGDAVQSFIRCCTSRSIVAVPIEPSSASLSFKVSSPSSMHSLFETLFLIIPNLNGFLSQKIDEIE